MIPISIDHMRADLAIIEMKIAHATVWVDLADSVFKSTNKWRYPIRCAKLWYVRRKGRAALNEIQRTAQITRLRIDMVSQLPGMQFYAAEHADPDTEFTTSERLH